MVIITKDDVLKIAGLSALSLTAEEVTSLTHDLQSILAYTEQLTQLALATREPLFEDYLSARTSWNDTVARICTVTREDVSTVFCADPLLEQAPERSDRFFVVPSIIEQDR